MKPSKDTKKVAKKPTQPGFDERLKRLGLLMGALAVLVLLFLIQRNKSPVPQGPVTAAQSEEFQKGAALAKTVCSSCHLYADPSILDKVTWGMEVLPAMGQFLGHHTIPYDELHLEQRVKDAKLIPEHPVINLEDWRALLTFYLGAAPVQAAPLAERPPLEIGLKNFQVIFPAERRQGNTTMVKIDPEERLIYVGIGKTNLLTAMEPNGREVASIQMVSPPVSLTPRPDNLWITLIGSYVPSDALEGRLVVLNKPKASQPEGAGGARLEDVLEKLPRPVHSVLADLNKDGREDILVCGYGNQLGHLSWFENQGGGNYKEHILLERCGAIMAHLHDFNKDGLPDVMVMMAQAREGIYIFLNQGQGQFSGPITVMEQHPAWGYSYFELVDFNGDGFVDILATNGDNGDHTDYLPPFKNYHGIRLYLNDGKNNFKEAWFYPMNGAYKAIARDFNQDGILDIAAISFYPDYRKSARESFVLLEGQGNLKFKTYSFEEAFHGRWIAMDVGDMDGDGDLDIVLGAYNEGPTYVPHLLFERWQEEGPHVLILKNTVRNR